MTTPRALALLAPIVLLAGGLGAGTPAAVAADPVLRYQPGKWETTTTMRMSMLPTPQVRTSTECLREGDYSAERLMRDQHGCTVVDPVVTPTSIRWSATCPSPNGSATGRGEYTITDDGLRGHGRVTIDMKMGDRTTTMTMEIASRRVGDCE
jgi:Protein of unknown function (DUF3617)